MRDNSETIALLYYATRTGKIVTAVMDTKNCGDRTLFLTHTQELVNQADTFRRLWSSVTVGRYMEAIRDPHRLNTEECRYAMNTSTHLDFLIYQRISKKSVLVIEVDGFHYHKQGIPQYDRDRMKDYILRLYGIPVLRFPINGSGEIEKIALALDAYAQTK